VMVEVRKRALERGVGQGGATTSNYGKMHRRRRGQAAVAREVAACDMKVVTT
jgi:hypothetical protein